MTYQDEVKRYLVLCIENQSYSYNNPDSILYTSQSDSCVLGEPYIEALCSYKSFEDAEKSAYCFAKLKKKELISRLKHEKENRLKIGIVENDGYIVCTANRISELDAADETPDVDSDFYSADFMRDDIETWLYKYVVEESEV